MCHQIFMITIATIINLFLQEYKPLWDDIKKKERKVGELTQ